MHTKINFFCKDFEEALQKTNIKERTLGKSCIRLENAIKKVVWNSNQFFPILQSVNECNMT